jgi:hypothetical protein
MSFAGGTVVTGPVRRVGGAVDMVLNRAQLESLYRAPIETITNAQTGSTAFLPG